MFVGNPSKFVVITSVCKYKVGKWKLRKLDRGV